MVGELGCQGVSDGGETTSLNQESVISYFRKVTHASCVTSCKYTHKEHIIYQTFSCIIQLLRYFVEVFALVPIF